jgi:NADH-quinone oxidoreductase subunit J
MLLALGLVGALTILGAALAIGLRDPIYAVLSLVLTMLGVAGVYFLLGAEYIGIIQIIVYAGAIMVTFLFVVMLISLSPGDVTPLPRGIVLWGPLGLALGWLSVMLYGLRSVVQLPLRTQVLQEEPAQTYLYGTAKSIGKALFTAYVLPFEELSFTLLVGIVGALLLVQKRPRYVQ